MSSKDEEFLEIAESVEDELQRLKMLGKLEEEKSIYLYAMLDSLDEMSEKLEAQVKKCKINLLEEAKSDAMITLLESNPEWITLQSQLSEHDEKSKHAMQSLMNASTIVSVVCAVIFVEVVLVSTRALLSSYMVTVSIAFIALILFSFIPYSAFLRNTAKNKRLKIQAQIDQLREKMEKSVESITITTHSL